MKLRIRARTGQAAGAHARHRISGRMRRLTATTLVLATTTGGLAAYGLAADASASVHTVAQAPPTTLLISKTASPTFFTGAGQIITYTYTITNSTGKVFTGVSVVDFKLVGGMRVATRNICDLGTVLNGTIRMCTFQYTTIPADVTVGSITNDAFVLVRGIANGRALTVSIPLRRTSVPVTG